MGSGGLGTEEMGRGELGECTTGDERLGSGGLGIRETRSGHVERGCVDIEDPGNWEMGKYG